MLAVAWAVYLIPKALQHHDEVARTRSIDRFSTAMRVLARREPVNRRDARLVVTPPRSTDNPRLLVPTPAADPVAAVAAPASRPPVAPRRAAARAAARRRRHILLFFLIVDLVVIALAGFAIAPRWSVAVPVALTLCYLVLCRTQVHREDDASWADDLAADEGSVAPRRAVRAEVPYGTPLVSPDEDTIAISTVALRAAVGYPAGYSAEVETVAVAVPTADGGSLWDPLPVTLPTYVNKPRASRTVRTIDLSEPGTWSSGRSAADSKLVEEAAAAKQELASDQGDQRAVGS